MPGRPNRPATGMICIHDWHSCAWGMRTRVGFWVEFLLLLYYYWLMCDNTSFLCFHVNGLLGYWLLAYSGLVMLLIGVLIYVSMSAMFSLMHLIHDILIIYGLDSILLTQIVHHTIQWRKKSRKRWERDKKGPTYFDRISTSMWPFKSPPTPILSFPPCIPLSLPCEAGRGPRTHIRRIHRYFWGRSGEHHQSWQCIYYSSC